jgi:hypothetical protein
VIGIWGFLRNSSDSLKLQLCGLKSLVGAPIPAEELRIGGLLSEFGVEFGLNTIVALYMLFSQ